MKSFGSTTLILMKVNLSVLLTVSVSVYISTGTVTGNGTGSVWYSTVFNYVISMVPVPGTYNAVNGIQV
jgi:hypothetical protein